VAVIEVIDLRVELTNGLDVVDEVSFSVDAGEVLGLVGESGSGKTTIGTSLLGYVRGGARIAGGRVVVDGVDVLAASHAELTRLRGKAIAYVPQDPAAGLNPARRIGRQLAEVVKVHQPSLGDDAVRARIAQVLGEVKLPQGRELLERYPHQLSGGQQQRVMLALAFVNRPKAIVLDEPTTGLDVTTQAHVLDTVRELCATHRVAAVYVSHDLALVKGLADHVVVAYAGRVVERARCAELFRHPAHPYSRALLDAIPDVNQRRELIVIQGHAPAPGQRPSGCAFADRCRYALPECREAQPDLRRIGEEHAARCFRAEEVGAMPAPLRLQALERPAAAVDAPVLAVRGLNASYGGTRILHDVAFTLERGRCLALVGESGSGKTTLSRCLIGLHAQWDGEASYKGQALARSARSRPASVRHELQYVFQNPYKALNPRHAVGASVAAPLAHFFGVRGREATVRVGEALERVSLPAALAGRLPRELSGGERQRVAIARALVCEPEVLICDEITSALDVSVQAAILELLEELEQERGLTLLFVTHNLAVVRAIATDVAVLRAGRIVEAGPTGRVLDDPEHGYTRELIADSPTLLEAGGSGASAGVSSSNNPGRGQESPW